MEYLDNIEDEYVAIGEGNSPSVAKPKEDGDDGEAIFQEPEPEPIYEPCDMRSTLYSLQPKALNDVNDFIQLPSTRPFLVKKIPNSNLVLVVVNVLMPSRSVRLTTEPVRITNYDTEFPCYKLNMSFYERRRIEECYTQDENVSQSKLSWCNLFDIYIYMYYLSLGGTVHLLRQSLAAGIDASAAAADHNFDVLLDALLYASLVYRTYTTIYMYIYMHICYIYIYTYVLLRSVCFLDCKLLCSTILVECLTTTTKPETN